PLSQFGLVEKDFNVIIEKTQRASSTKGNPIQLTDEELYGILAKAA
ncbi:MAG: alcohol dehydrogenase, partial [Desulfobacterales bacterium]|nr:alcohol dehydrogenase [Desulfobacterales bacterium]